MDRPFILVGDGWQNPTGLGRIARDLAQVLQVDCHIGFHPPATLVRANTRQASFGHLGEDWNAEQICQWIAAQYHVQDGGVLLIVWDPARAWHFLAPFRRLLPHWQLWGYFAIDGINAAGTIGGPAAEAIERFDRVLAYSQFGAEIIKDLRSAPTPWLPHGIQPFDDEQIGSRTSCLQDVRSILLPTFDPYAGDWLLGCVASNQPRKDLGLFCDILQQLQQRGERVWGWLHTDVLVKTWALPELAAIHAIEDRLRVTLGEFDDLQLARFYRACEVTIGVGRGEGFGYTHIESLAVGTPCLHVNYGGGAEFLPYAWRMPYEALDHSNVYGIGRPVQEASAYVGEILHMHQQDRAVVEAFAKGAVEHLRWTHLQGRWQTWKRHGLERMEAP